MIVMALALRFPEPLPYKMPEPVVAVPVKRIVPLLAVKGAVYQATPAITLPST